MICAFSNRNYLASRRIYIISRFSSSYQSMFAFLFYYSGSCTSIVTVSLLALFYVAMSDVFACLLVDCSMSDVREELLRCMTNYS